MIDLLLAEELFLLTHDDESGREEGTLVLSNALAGALLLDLARAELLVAKDDKLAVAPGTPGHPLLARAHEVLAKEDKPRSATRLIGRLDRELRPLGAKVGQSLTERGILAEQKGKLLGLFPRTTWPELDPAPERELRADLHAVLVEGAEPDVRRALLIALLLPMNLIRRLVPKDARREAQQRAKQIATSNPGVAEGVAKSIRDAQNAVIVAMAMPAIVGATTAATS